MRWNRFALALMLCGPVWAPVGAQQAAPAPIIGAHYPALSPDGRRICFSYQGDLWTCSSSGGAASRLTVHEAYDAYPRWSPDGRWIAFSSNREGNFDLYIIPTIGGTARRITWHSANDILCDWTPDGSALLFAAARESRWSDLYTVSLRDGRLHRLTRDQTGSSYAVYSADGKSVIYTRGGQTWWRPRYRGSRSADIWSLPSDGGKAIRLTSNSEWDAWPMPIGTGKSVAWVAQRGERSLILSAAGAGGKERELVSSTGDPIRFASASRSGDDIVFERDFGLWISRLPDAPHKLEIYAPGESRRTWDALQSLDTGAGPVAVSPDGKSLAFAARGEIWTMPVAGGEAARVTRTASPEYAPRWAPDGSHLLYTAARAGRTSVYMMDMKTRTEVAIDTGPDNCTDAAYDPRGRFVAWVRAGSRSAGLYVLPIPPQGPPRPADAVCVAPGSRIGAFTWSPDGRWLAYDQRDATSTSDIWIVPCVGGTPVNVTRFPGVNASPLWTRDGRNLVFTSTRGFAAGSSQTGLCALPLLPDASRAAGQSGGPATAPPEEEDDGDGPEAQRRRPPAAPVAPEAERGANASPSGGFPGFPPAPLADVVRIDFDGIENRTRILATPRDGFSAVALAPDARSVIYASGPGTQAAWWMADIPTGSVVRLSDGGPVGGAPVFSPDGGELYFSAPGGLPHRLSRSSTLPTRIGFTASMEVDRRAEIAEAFEEAWRALRNGFYDPSMHGANWDAVGAHYRVLLPSTVVEEDFGWLLQAMVGELNASHTGATPPSRPGPSIATGLLGLQFDDAYAGAGMKVASVLARGPADTPGSKVTRGQYVLAVDGKAVTYGEALFAQLADRAGLPVDLLMNTRPERAGAWTVTVRPILRAESDNLEYEQWVRDRRRIVEERTGGQVAYLHIRAMDQPSLRRFERELFGDARTKSALVLDVRFNGGGRIHDELLELLARRPHVTEVPRDSEPSTQPFRVWARPIVLLINEYSASDAEIFPNGFRQYALGKIVGVPTYGAVIGTTDITLQDGTRFRVPRTGWFTLGGKNLENLGVSPDLLVEHSPEDNAADHDLQLEAAIRVLVAPITQGK